MTGFETGEIDLILKDLDESEDDKADAVVAVKRDKPAISRPGDLWQLGPHRLLCGNARDGGAYARLLYADKAAIVFSDPPHNVPIDGHVRGLGATRLREFAEASGEMSLEAFTAFLTTVFTHMAAASRDGALHYIFMDWRHMGEMLAARATAYDRLINLVVWRKTNAGMGSLYRSAREMILIWKQGRSPHINNVQLGAQGRHRSNVWTYPGVNAFRRGRATDLADHRTRAIEIDAHYVDTAIRHWQDFTGRGDKIMRMHGQTARIEAGQVDALSQLLIWNKTPTRRTARAVAMCW